MKNKAESGKRKAETDNRVSRFTFHVSRVSLIALLAAVASLAFADKLANTIVTGFGPVPLEWHDPPFEAKPKTILSGAEAEPQAASHLIVIRKVHLQILNTNGEVQMVVEAPECVLDMENHEVNSSGVVAVRTGDGKLLHGGKGFLWQQTNSIFIISNGVRTAFHGSATNFLFQ